MFFVGQKTTAQLQLTTPLTHCCNCGSNQSLSLVPTPLQKTRYFLFFGTELELSETFPYCPRCKGSARRVKLSLSGKLLVAAMLTAAGFLALVLTAPDLPPVVQHNLFASSALAGVGLAAGYFLLRERQGAGRSYYQPVSLVEAKLFGDRLQSLHLRFSNAQYAQIFSRANAELLSARMLKVEHD